MKFLVIILSVLMLTAPSFAKKNNSKALKYLIENSNELMLIDTKIESKEMPSVADLLSDVLTTTPVVVGDKCNFINKSLIENCKVSVKLYDLSVNFSYNFEFKRYPSLPVSQDPIDALGKKRKVMFSVTEHK